MNQEIRKSHRPLKVRTFLSSLVQKEDGKQEPLFLEKYNYSSLHIKRVLKCFDEGHHNSDTNCNLHLGKSLNSQSTSDFVSFLYL